MPAVGWQLWQLDMTSQASVDALMKRMKDTYGRIDFLFLNAGGHSILHVLSALAKLGIGDKLCKFQVRII
jgi:NADP-dependent 3-hydroxy acid dehydrogenase YdfG